MIRRVRITDRRPLGALSSATIAAAILLLGLGSALAARPFIKVGTGSVSSVYYQAGGAVCSLVNAGRKEHQIRCTVSSSAGAIANIAALRRGERAFGFAQADLVQQAYNGSGAFSDSTGFDGLRTVLALHPETVTIVARSGAGIDDVQDLRGQRVNLGPEGSGHRASMHALMNALGWSERDFAAATELSVDQQVRALCNGDIDAAMFIAGHPSSVVKRAMNCGASLVPVAGPAINRLVRNAPYYSSTVIPASAYGDVDTDVQTFGVTALLLSSTNTPRSTVFATTRAVLEDIDGFKSWHAAFRDLDRAGMARGVDVVDAPRHPGARLYLEEQGLL